MGTVEIRLNATWTNWLELEYGASLIAFSLNLKAIWETENIRHTELIGYSFGVSGKSLLKVFTWCAAWIIDGNIVIWGPTPTVIRVPLFEEVEMLA